MSYSYDDAAHVAWVRALAGRLSMEQLQLRLDAWVVLPGDSLTAFMEEELRFADVVLVVCTPAYARKANRREGGVGFEGQIISSSLLRRSSARCIPVVARGTLEPGPECAIPTFLEGRKVVFFNDGEPESAYTELLSAILGKPLDRPPGPDAPPELLSDASLAWGRHGGQRATAAIDYTSPLSLDFGIVANAIDVIQALANPAAWDDFRDTGTGRPWMLCDNDVVISTLYSIWAPMAHYALERTSWERRFAGFPWRSKLQFLLTAAVAATYQDDDLIAGIAPIIPYTPRVADWRRKREREPARYWWQGLSEERWQKAAAQFLVADRTGERTLISSSDFRTRYLSTYDGGPPRDAQAIGLAANALFRFTTYNRPVFWRLLVCQALLYHGILRSRSKGLTPPTSVGDILTLARPVDDGAFPLGDAAPEAERYETLKTTVNAAQSYLRDVVAPRLLLRIR